MASKHRTDHNDSLRRVEGQDNKHYGLAGDGMTIADDGSDREAFLWPVLTRQTGGKAPTPAIKRPQVAMAILLSEPDCSK